MIGGCALAVAGAYGDNDNVTHAFQRIVRVATYSVYLKTSRECMDWECAALTGP
jgi:hypothetical protein